MKKKVLSFTVIIFLILGIASTTAKGSDVVINEVMPSNDRTAADQNGEYDDWIELYNNSGTSVDLSGYYLTDKKGNLTKWQFPSNTTISGNGYLIVWADKDTLQSGLHTNFKLSADGESLLLITPQIGVADQVKYGVADSTREISYARIPNGIGSFVWQTPTFGKSNNTIASVKEIKNVNFSIYPNPVQTSLTIKNENTGISQELIVYNITGDRMYTALMDKSVSIDVSSWKNGIYFIAVNGQSFKKMLVKH
jgi:hypothetical protein